VRELLQIRTIKADKMPLQFVASKRGGELLLCVNNFLFRKTSSKNEVDYYYCCTINCKSSARVSNNTISFLKESHAHSDDEEKINTQKIAGLKSHLSQELISLSEFMWGISDIFHLE
jgi:hypothetical protein